MKKIKFLRLACIVATVSQICSVASAQNPGSIRTSIAAVQANAFARQQEFFPADSSLELVFSGGCGVMEGLTSVPDGRVFFTEITRSVECADVRGVPGGRIWVLEPGAAKPRVFREPSGMAAGLAAGAQGSLFAAEGADHGMRRVSRTDLGTGEYRVIAYMHDNRQFNAPNDVTTDSKGRVYFSDIRLFGPETLDQRIHGVYRLDPPSSGTRGTWPVTRIIGNNSKINGVEVSRDDRTLYAGFCDLGTNALGEQAAADLDRGGQAGLVAYALDENGNASRPRVLLDLEKSGCVDGMTTDAAGNLYATVGSSAVAPGVYVFTPEGVLVARLVLPNNERPVNVGFGRGAHADLLYISIVSGGKVYRIKTGKPGY